MRNFIHSTILLIFLCIILMPTNAQAVIESKDFEKNPSVIHFLSLTSLYSWIDHGMDYPIECFDVNESEKIAIGFSGLSDQKYIGVYDKLGNFYYGYTFNCSGDFLIEWVNEEQIAIYWTKSSVRTIHNQQSKCQEYWYYEADPSMTHHLNSLSKTTREVNGEKYIIDQGGNLLSHFALNYARLIHISSSGEKSIIYNAAFASSLSGLLVLSSFCFIIFLFVHKSRNIVQRPISQIRNTRKL